MSDVSNNGARKPYLQMPGAPGQISEGDRVVLTKKIITEQVTLPKGSAGDVLDVNRDYGGDPDSFYIIFNKFPRGLTVPPEYLKFVRGPRVKG